MYEAQINIEALRNDLLNYYMAATYVYPVALMDISKVQTASEEELIQIALNNNFNLENYVIRHILRLGGETKKYERN